MSRVHSGVLLEVKPPPYMLAKARTIRARVFSTCCTWDRASGLFTAICFPEKARRKLCGRKHSLISCLYSPGFSFWNTELKEIRNAVSLTLSRRHCSPGLGVAGEESPLSLPWPCKVELLVHVGWGRGNGVMAQMSHTVAVLTKI